jgi:hypothetical protein
VTILKTKVSKKLKGLEENALFKENEKSKEKLNKMIEDIKNI